MINRTILNESTISTIENAKKTLISNRLIIDKFLDSSMIKIIEAAQKKQLMINQLLNSPTLQIISAAQKSLKASQLILNPYVNKIIQDQIKFQKRIKLIKERREQEKVAMLESGWWLTPSLMELPATTIDKAIDNYLSGEKGAITNLFASFYQNNNCENLELVIDFWNSNCKFIKKWIPVINQAFEAHKRSEYLLSIPALLLACEGIANDYCKSFNITVPRNKGNQKIRRSIEQVLSSDSRYIREELLFEILDNQVYADTSNKKRASYKYFLNRHAVLHGVSYSYGSRKNSLKCFMLIDVLSLLN